MKFIDLRSDTVTHPTDEMRQAMANAEVGDDVYQDDPTTKELEKYAAEITGKEAALFVPSGTFGNQLALFTHCERGNEVIIGKDSHIIVHEVGAASVIAGVQMRTLNTKKGEMNIEEIEETIRKEEDIHFPKTGLIALENAYSNGKALSLNYMKNVRKISKKYNIPIHLDGARLFNAATALNVDVKEIADEVDSIQFCLSKGLCSPIGSLLVGRNSFIEKARKKRKLMGGGLRQTGILAAAGLISLKKMTKRLNEDHIRAKKLAKEISKIPGISIDIGDVDINLVFFKIDKNKYKIDDMVDFFRKRNIIINPEENGYMRFVTHYWIKNEDIEHVIETTKRYFNYMEI
ncbi:low-specificity L-threonine aldolase [Geotoga petraea]|uniref:L-threonine aldolase n=1 Tax=Geotoga petraea TaxID=28234 RepID=A0A1G6QH34_9BACT|nr:low-specificity L-threonine aldolase [Geotoga petraea]SDC91016.1 L-threonine aldolase [Geotoga petraea]